MSWIVREVSPRRSRYWNSDGLTKRLPEVGEEPKLTPLVAAPVDSSPATHPFQHRKDAIQQDKTPTLASTLTSLSFQKTHKHAHSLCFPLDAPKSFCTFTPRCSSEDISSLKTTRDLDVEEDLRWREEVAALLPKLLTWRTRRRKVSHCRRRPGAEDLAAGAATSMTRCWRPRRRLLPKFWPPLPPKKLAAATTETPHWKSRSIRDEELQQLPPKRPHQTPGPRSTSPPEITKEDPNSAATCTEVGVDTKDVLPRVVAPVP